MSPPSATVKHSNTPQLQVSTCHGVRAYLKKTGIVRHTETEETETETGRNRERQLDKRTEAETDRQTDRKSYV